MTHIPPDNDAGLGPRFNDAGANRQAMGMELLSILSDKKNIDRGRAAILVAAGADMTVENSLKNTALTLAIRHGETALALQMIDAGAPIEHEDVFGNTALKWAIWMRNDDIAVKLLSCKARHDMTDVFGQTPLHIAARFGRTRIIEALLDAGADPNPRNKNSRTPLDYALRNGHTDAAGLLQSRGGLDTAAKPLPHIARPDFKKAAEKVKKNGNWLKRFFGFGK